MRKREREITMLYGICLIRDDVLRHPEPTSTTSENLISFIHTIMRAGAIAALIMAALMIPASLIPLWG